jgi:DNA-binding GntR family transcriptional regulator
MRLLQQEALSAAPPAIRTMKTAKPRNPPKYNTVAETAFEHVRERILAGKLKPGEKINQTILATELGVSLIPLREAFKRLEAEGYITIIPHRGAYVKGLSREEAEDLYIMRAELEEVAAGLAADKLTDKDIKALRHQVQQMAEAIKKGHYASLLTLNRRFHFTIYNACGRTHLLEILEYFWDRCSRYRNIQTSKPELDALELREHREILKACIARDRQALMKAVRFNVEQSWRNLQQMPLAD